MKAIRPIALAIGTVVALLCVPQQALALFTAPEVVPDNTISTATLAPATGVTAGGVCNGSSPAVSVSWTASTSTFAESYLIYRSDTSGGSGSNIGVVDAANPLSFTDTAVAAGTTYYYSVLAEGRGWTSVASNEASATTPGTCP